MEVPMKRILVLLIFLIIVVCGSGIVGIVLYRSMTEKYKSEHLLSVDKIEKMGKLELVKVNIKDVLEQTSERPFYLPNAKAVLIIAGEVIAGIDLEKVQKDDIADSGTQITITLPKPEILMSKVNHEKSKIYNIEWGGFSTANLVDEAYKTAEMTIIEEARKTGFEEMCKNNAKALLTPIFREISGKEINILFRN
jgi:NAD dependent epimerase/dehydratase family enzyme